MEIFIEGILGPGVTVLGSEMPHHRRIILEQMAVAISSGEEFLGLLKSKQRQLLFIARGNAEYEAFRSRVNLKKKDLDLRHEWPRFGKGCMEHLSQHLMKHFNLGVVFLGDYNGIVRKVPYADGNIIAGQEVAREKNYRDMARLRDWSSKNEVALVLGHDLSTRGQLLYAGSLKYRDNELQIKQVRGEWRLEAVPGSNYVSAESWPLLYDDERKFFRVSDSVLRARPGGKLPLVENERQIIDTLWESGPLTTKQIMEETKIPYTTLHDRLMALQTKEKGEWIIRLELEGAPINYMVDTSKKREWLSGYRIDRESTR